MFPAFFPILKMKLSYFFYRNYRRKRADPWQISEYLGSLQKDWKLFNLFIIKYADHSTWCLFDALFTVLDTFVGFKGTIVRALDIWYFPHPPFQQQHLLCSIGLVDRHRAINLEPCPYTFAIAHLPFLACSFSTFNSLPTMSPPSMPCLPCPILPCFAN